MTDKKPAPGGFDLEDLNAVAASDQGAEFEYELDGKPTGIWFRVLGSHATKIQALSNQMVNDRNEKDRAREAALMKGKDVAAEPVETQIKFGRRLAAERIIGWRTPDQTDGLTPEQAGRFKGIKQPYSPELALKLIESNADVAAKVLLASNDLGSFMKALSPGS